MGDTFLKGISPKLNVIVRLEVKLAYSNVTAIDVSIYVTGTPLDNLAASTWPNCVRVLVWYFNVFGF